MCTASNGVGPLQHATITLSVLYAPTVEAVEEHVQGGGTKVSLACRVGGHPPPSVTWFRDGRNLSLEGGESSAEWRRDTRVHSLTLLSDSGREFGNYSCVARNIMGTARRFIEVHGRPSPVTFLPTAPANPYEVNLRWKVVSHSPVSLFTVLFRKAGDGEWRTVKVAGDEQDDNSKVGQGSCTLGHLVPSTTYEAIVQAKNLYGWSEPSQMELIKTSPEEGKSAESLWSGGLPYAASSNNLELGLLCVLVTLVLRLF